MLITLIKVNVQARQYKIVKHGEFSCKCHPDFLNVLNSLHNKLYRFSMKATKIWRNGIQVPFTFCTQKTGRSHQSFEAFLENLKPTKYNAVKTKYIFFYFSITIFCMDVKRLISKVGNYVLFGCKLLIKNM